MSRTFSPKSKIKILKKPTSASLKSLLQVIVDEELNASVEALTLADSEIETSDSSVQTFARLVEQFNQQLVQTPKPAKIIDENLLLCTEANRVLTDQAGSLVVGVIGRKGVGKTSLIHHLLDINSSLKTTKTVDVYKGSNLVCIDTFPIFCMHSIENYRKGRIPENKDLMDYDLKSHKERWLSTLAVQLSLYLMTLCHCVIVVSDDFQDLQLVKLLKTSARLFEKTVKGKLPRILHVYNKVHPSPLELKQQITKLQSEYASTKLVTNNGLSTAKWNQLYHSVIPTEIQSFNLVFIPKIVSLSSLEEQNVKSIISETFMLPASAEAMIDQLKEALLTVPRSSIESVPLEEFAVTEKEWFKSNSTKWEIIRKNSNLQKVPIE